MAPDVHVVLQQARWLAGDPWTLEGAIGALEELTRSLEPDDDPDVRFEQRAGEPLRTLLSTHLLAVRTLQDVAASSDAVTKLVHRAIDRAEHAARTTPGRSDAAPSERVS